MLISLFELRKKINDQYDYIIKAQGDIAKSIEKCYVAKIQEKAANNWFYRTFTDYNNKIYLACIYCKYDKDTLYKKLDGMKVKINKLYQEFYYTGSNYTDKEQKKMFIRITDEEASVLDFKV